MLWGKAKRQAGSLGARRRDKKGRGSDLRPYSEEQAQLGYGLRACPLSLISIIYITLIRIGQQSIINTAR